MLRGRKILGEAAARLSCGSAMLPPCSDSRWRCREEECCTRSAECHTETVFSSNVVTASANLNSIILTPACCRSAAVNLTNGRGKKSKAGDGYRDGVNDSCEPRPLLTLEFHGLEFHLVADEVKIGASNFQGGQMPRADRAVLGDYMSNCSLELGRSPTQIV